MKKNLFLKNNSVTVRKAKLFERVFLVRAINSNFYFSRYERSRFGFLSQTSKNKMGFLGVTNSRSQCFLTWRTGSFYSFFRLTRLTLKENFSFGFIKGLRKSS